MHTHTRYETLETNDQGAYVSYPRWNHNHVPIFRESIPEEATFSSGILQKESKYK